MPSISCSDLSFEWPDGTEVLSGVDLSLGPGATGLIGGNGAGKSTLLRLLGRLIAPTGGSAQVDGTLAYLPQHLPLEATARVDEILGIAEIRAALRAVAEGDIDERRLSVIGDDWDAEERARATLDRLGLASVALDRTVGTLSGGEAILLGLASRLHACPDVLLLDEPTNNLDLRRRRYLYDSVERFRGVLVVVSHDRALLDRVDRIVELRDGTARVHGGNLTSYEQALAVEQEAAQRAVRAAGADLRRQQRELEEAQTKLARRARSGRKAAAQGMPKIVAHARKKQAQESAGKLRGTHAQRIAEARQRLAEAEEAVRDPDEARVDLPETEVPSRRAVLRVDGLNVALARRGGDPALSPPLWGRDLDLVVRGPERVALLGANGAGKTTLLRCIAGQVMPAHGTLALGVDGVGYLPQRLDVLDDTRSVRDNLRGSAPTATDHDVRARLARFGFRGDAVDLAAGTLSGGERFRAVLATLLAADPPPQLLLLDEPTNNLDLHTAGQLRDALDGYRGALLIASHDLPFLAEIGITRWLRLDRAHGLAEDDPPHAP